MAVIGKRTLIFFIDLYVNFEPLLGPQYCLRDTILTIQNSQNIYMYKLGVNISIPGAMGFEKEDFQVCLT